MGDGGLTMADKIKFGKVQCDWKCGMEAKDVETLTLAGLVYVRDHDDGSDSFQLIFSDHKLTDEQFEHMIDLIGDDDWWSGEICEYDLKNDAIIYSDGQTSCQIN